MPKPTNKNELTASMQDGYAKLNEQINKTSPYSQAAKLLKAHQKNSQK